MEYGYLILKATGEIEVLESDDYEFTLEELRSGSDCDTIQIVGSQVVRDLLLCIDDNGKILGKEVNVCGSVLYAPGYDVIVGDVVVGTRRCPDVDAEPDIYKLPLEECHEFKSALLLART